MSREVTEAHYLHERSGLEAVLRPPVKRPTVVKWIPKREELLCATRDGQMVSVDPVLGTRIIADDLGEIAVVDIHDDQKTFLAIGRDGKWFVGTVRGGVEIAGKHSFMGNMQGFFASNYVVMIGDTGKGRQMLIYSREGERKGRVALPKKVVATKSETGKLLLCRSTPAGLKVIPFPKGRFPQDLDSTVHRLMASHLWIVGVTITGICVWGQKGGQPHSMRLPDLTAGDIRHDGTYLGLGTRSGAVALARMDSMDRRVRPDLVRAFNAPVTSVAFSPRGRWLATGAEGLRIWSWED
ncbi:MAG: hypothetical protein GWP91_02145 [Rhodobacterales bacterium]|nr:hypothetical protein [Rhodobacterales bacterium]